MRREQYRQIYGKGRGEIEYDGIYIKKSKNDGGGAGNEVKQERIITIRKGDRE